ncbi:MAG: hypothetical protein CFE39_03220 [Comamonadaceae bacterium PBBC2]|nr:MAG: hypothetical protein CFE39_03220 [Comamonadaceae bacterium PBBC2]
MLCCVALVGVLASCGGGSGGGAEAPTVPSVVEGFPLQAAYKARAALAQTEEFVVSGTCNGTVRMVTGQPVAASFEGVAVQQASQSTQVALSDCTPNSVISTGSTFLDGNYVPVGASVDGQEYARYAAAPAALPASVKPGDGATVVTLNTFTNSTKLIATGRRTWAYLVEADSAAAVFVRFVQKSYNTADLLLATQQARYRLDKSGTLSLLSIDIQYGGTSQNHLLYTPTRLVVSPPVSATPTYPLQQAYTARLTTGSSERFVVSGSCNGTATLSESAPAAANFEGLTVQATSQTALVSLSDCSPGTSAVVGSNFYDTNYLILGSVTPGQEYAKVIGIVAPLPSLVQVGDAATVVPLNLFIDNTKAVSTGRRTVGYAIEPDSVNSVVANFITRSYNTADQLLSTQQVRYRLDNSAVFKLLSIEIQNSTTNTARLVYTPIPGSFTQVPAWPW